MKLHCIAACVAAFLSVPMSVPVSAQEVMAVYDARLGPQDLVNSSGARLGNFCAVVQQDRANYHRFGKRDPVDMSDPVFGNSVLRGRIANTCEIEPGYEYLRDGIFTLGGYGYVIRVKVLNDAGQMRVLVSERAG